MRLGLVNSTSTTTTTAATDLRAAALAAYEHTTAHFVVDYGNGTLGFNGTVLVCSLNSSATVDYYLGRPINFNAPLGAAAFVLASLEVERLALAEAGS